MRKRRVLWSAGAGIAVALFLSRAAGGGSAELLAPSKGQMPNDTDGGAVMALEEKAELGGNALKVAFAQGSSVGETKPKVTDWTPFRSLRFEVLNPTDKPVSLTLCVRHKGTTGYQSRADTPLLLKPGKNSIGLLLREMANVDGSRPDLSLVRHWYLTCDAGETTVYFGDFTLAGEAGATAPAPATPPAAHAAGGQVRITGKVGDMVVDLTVTGLGGAPAAAPATPAPAPAAAGARTPLLAVSKGSLPNDTTANPKVSLEESAELGGACLKVEFAKGSSFGMSRAGLTDWRGYATLRFSAFNPASTPLAIQLTIKHGGSKSYGTRVDKELVLAPGRNDLAVPIAGAANNDGSAPDLSSIRQWYITCNSEATALFGDFALEKSP